MELLLANENHCPVQMVDLGSVWRDDEAQTTMKCPPDSYPAEIGSYYIDLGAIFCPPNDGAWTCRTGWSGLRRAGELP